MTFFPVQFGRRAPDLASCPTSPYTAGTLPSVSIWADVAYGLGEFYVVGPRASRGYARSADGITWSGATTGGSLPLVWNSVEFNGTTFAMAGANGTTLGVPDAATDVFALGSDGTWTNHNGPATGTYGSAYRYVFWCFDRWIAVGNVYGGGVGLQPWGSNNIAYSTDGATWVGAKAAFSANGTQSVQGYAAAGNGSIIVLTGNVFAASAGEYCTSADGGATWTKRNYPGGLTAQGTGVAWNGSTFVIVFYGASVCLTSPDGTTWTQRSMGVSEAWTDVIYNGVAFVAVGQTRLAFSLDGISWTVCGVFGSHNWRAAFNTVDEYYVVAPGRSPIDDSGPLNPTTDIDYVAYPA